MPIAYSPHPSPSADKPEKIWVTAYNTQVVEHFTYAPAEDLVIDASKQNWIYINGIHREANQKISEQFNIHSLILEDMHSKGQRTKLDDLGEQIYCLCYYLQYDAHGKQIKTTQVNLILGNHFLIANHKQMATPVFKTILDKLQASQTKINQKRIDYLLYVLLDIIVDEYFVILDKISDKIEKLEHGYSTYKQNQLLSKLQQIKRELMLNKRTIYPLREVLNALIQSDSPLIHKNTKKYFKDIQDHVLLAIEYNESYREQILSIQELYMNQMNTRLNERITTLTIVTMLLAPATIIGSIYGMNFQQIPLSEHPQGFYVAIGLMIGLSLITLIIFKLKKWF